MNKKKIILGGCVLFALAFVMATGYKSVFDMVYKENVPFSYQDPTIWKYFNGGKPLDINANGIFTKNIFGKVVQLD